ncbi:ImmA/IrrE family metallo-endopeptidase [Bacillus sp. FSL K6-0047]
MRYSTEKETRISHQLKSMGINSAADLSYENLCEVFNIDIQYHEGQSKCIFEDDYALFLLDSRLSYYEQRRVFFHELSHYFCHSGNQKHLPKPLLSLQEEQASYISLYIAMPRHIFEPELLKHQSVAALQEIFELPETMIVDRCNSLKRQRRRAVIQTRIAYKNSQNRRKSLQPENIYDGTKEMLRQLASQVGEESMSYEVRRLL